MTRAPAALAALLALLAASAAVVAAVPPAPPAPTDAGGEGSAAGAVAGPPTGPGVPTSVRPSTSFGGAAGPRQAAATTNHTNGTRLLTLPGGADRSDVRTVALDVGRSTALSVNATTIRLRTRAVERRVEAADAEGRERRLLDAIAAVERRAAALDSRQRAAVRAYAAGDITADELLVRLVAIRNEALLLADRVRTLEALSERTDDFTLPTERVQSLLFDLRAFDGPVLKRLAAGVSGDAPMPRVYVAAGSDGVVLATVDDGTYYREAVRFDYRARDGSSIAPTTARNVTARSYPEVWAEKTSDRGSGSGGTFVFTVPYPGGGLTAFVDGGSERVFRSHRRIPLANFTTGAAVQAQQDDLLLRVNRTFPGGALRVTLVDAETGEPLDATIRVGRRGGESVNVGRTGADGVLWTLAPDGEFIVTAIRTDTTTAAFVQASTTDPPTVDEAFARASPR